MHPREGGVPRRDARAAVRARARRHLLPVDAAVPLQRDHGRLGARSGGRRVDRVAPQVLRVAVLPGCAAVRRDVRQLRRQAAVLHPGHARHPDDADNPLRIAYGNEGAPRDLDRFAAAVRCHGGRRLRLQRGRGVDRAHPGHPGRRTGPAGRRDDDPRRRHRRAECPPGVVGELVNTDRARPVPRLLQGPGRRGRADGAAASITAATWPTATRTASRTSPGGSATGCAWTARTSAPHRSNGS